jgi:hypothetical protein
VSQLELRPTDWALIWEEDRRLLRQMAERIGNKVCAIDLDVAPSQLSHALDERDRNLPAKWIAYLVTNAGELGDDYVRRLAKLRGLEVIEAQPLKPAEELAELKAALAECLGPELRQAVLAKAKRRRR